MCVLKLVVYITSNKVFLAPLTNYFTDESFLSSAEELGFFERDLKLQVDSPIYKPSKRQLRLFIISISFL